MIWDFRRLRNLKISISSSACPWAGWQAGMQKRIRDIGRSHQQVTSTRPVIHTLQTPLTAAPTAHLDLAFPGFSSAPCRSVGSETRRPGCVRHWLGGEHEICRSDQEISSDLARDECGCGWLILLLRETLAALASWCLSRAKSSTVSGADVTRSRFAFGRGHQSRARAPGWTKVSKRFEARQRCRQARLKLPVAGIGSNKGRRAVLESRRASSPAAVPMSHLMVGASLLLCIGVG